MACQRELSESGGLWPARRVQVAQERGEKEIPVVYVQLSGTKEARRRWGRV